VKYFLLTYDRQRRKIVTYAEFPFEQRNRALAARASLVQLHRENPNLEIVLLGANAFDDLKKTHSRYFKTVDQLAKQKKRERDPALTG
jgi:putative NADH-flavin reductase